MNRSEYKAEHQTMRIMRKLLGCKLHDTLQDDIAYRRLFDIVYASPCYNDIPRSTLSKPWRITEPWGVKHNIRALPNSYPRPTRNP